MASGVFRPYTLADVLGTINAQQNQQAESVTGVGQFAEADETMPTADSMTTTVAAAAAWDGGMWGATLWS